VIPLARAILSALEMCFVIKRYTNLRFLPLQRKLFEVSSAGFEERTKTSAPGVS